MAKINLTSQTKQYLESHHKMTQDGRVPDRMKAILLASEGRPSMSITKALRISEFTINKYLDDYWLKGKLHPKNKGSESHLNEVQTKQLIERISANSYAHTHQIVAYIFERWNIKYGDLGLNKWLHHQGFTYKKPKGVTLKVYGDLQVVFIKKYTALNNILTDDGIVLFFDAVYPTQSTKITYGWVRNRVDKSINTARSRTRLNIVSVIELNNLSMAIFDQSKNFNGDAMIEVFKTIRKAYPAKNTIHRVLDGTTYHKSTEVVKKACELNIKLHRLPPYSSNLNTIERLWKVMNEYARNIKYSSQPKKIDIKSITVFVIFYLKLVLR